MLRQIWFTCLLAMVSLAFTAEAFSAGTNFNFEMRQIITETRSVVALMNKNGLGKYVQAVQKQLNVVENEYRDFGNTPRLKKSLVRLNGELSCLHATWDLVWGYYAGLNNNAKQVELLKLSNRMLYLIDDIKKRIVKVLK